MGGGGFLLLKVKARLCIFRTSTDLSAKRLGPSYDANTAGMKSCSETPRVELRTEILMHTHGTFLDTLRKIFRKRKGSSNKSPKNKRLVHPTDSHTHKETSLWLSKSWSMKSSNLET